MNTLSLDIAPQTCVIVRTQEEVTMPNDAFGFLATKGSVAAKGLVTANTKLDPLFHGHLNIPVFNVGSRAVCLQRGDSFCSIVFWETESPIVGKNTRTAIKVEHSKNNAFRELLSRNKSHLISGLFSVVASIAAALITLNLA